MPDSGALAASVRSGLVETYHDGAVAVCRPDGSLVASFGDIDRPFFIRSASKPFQAYVSQSNGAELSTLQLAVAASSHRGHPVQVAIVEQMLASVGLDEHVLGCPPDWPSNRVAARRLIAAGEPSPRRLFHNCSGKHSGFLRASVSNGWSTADYLNPDHPLQRQVTELLAGLGRFDPEPVGVDGCGAPVHRTTVRVMALMFAALATDARFAEVYTAMHRYPALVGGNGESDSQIATCLDAVAKGGAQGCIGVGLAAGFGLAVKSWDGLPAIPGIGAVAALDQLDLLSGPARERLAAVARPVVTGAGKPVGEFEPRFKLKTT